MDSRVGATIGIALVTAVLAGFSAYGDIRAGGADADHEAAGTVATSDSAARDSASLPAPRWLNDANIISLIGVMNTREIAAANAELQGWHADSVRAIAAATVQEHQAMQHSVDSVAAAARIAPVAPAMAAQLDTTLKLQVDSLAMYRGGALDRAFLQQQVNSHQLMASYLDEMTSMAEHPEVQGLLASMSGHAAEQAARARAMQIALVRADSTAAADSVKARSAKRNGTNTNR